MELRDPGPPARLTRIALLAARALAIAGPTALAFFAGGYFTGARLIAALAAWAALAALAVLGPPPPRRPGAAAVAAVGGLTLLLAWTAASVGRAPVADAADAQAQLAALYLGALVAAALAFRTRGASRWLEPGLAAGALVVVGYGLAGRLVPGLVPQHHQLAAGGRLDQPLTYWNAIGALGAIGIALCARMAGDASRPAALRVAAAAAATPLGLGVYLTYSRGAMGALGAGLLVLIAIVPAREQLRSVAIALEGGVLAAVVASRFGGVASLTGSLGHREAQGAAVLAALVAITAGAAALQAWSVRAERAGTAGTGPLPRPRRARAIAWTLAVAVAAAPYAAALAERGTANPEFGATAARLGSVGTHRYAYWRVAVHAWLEKPLVGDGPGSFRVQWLERRPFVETVHDAHSLELQTLAELGLLGLALLALFLGGVAASVRRVVRTDAALGAGLAAALAVWLVHSGVDWDWQVPALTLVAAVLAGAAVGLAARRSSP